MTCLQLEATTYPPKPPSPHPLKLWSDSAYKTTCLSFQKPRSTPQPTFPSLSNKNTHLFLLDGPGDSTVCASILDSCRSLAEGKLIHAFALKHGFTGNEFVETKLLRMYSRCGCLDDAILLFDKMSMRNLYAWVAIMSVYLEYDLFEEAFLLFEELLYEDTELDFFVFPVVLKICSGLKEIEIGRQIHGIVIKQQFLVNIFVGNALIDMYGKCGKLDDAKKVFSSMPEMDCVSWNSLISACAFNGMVYEALAYLGKMSSLEDLSPNIVSWSAVIGGFAQNGYDKEAIVMLSRMQAAGFEPNAQTLASVLPACAGLQSVSLGTQIHAYITRHGFLSNPILVNGLLDVYRRSGDMGSALKIFSKFSVKNVMSYNTMIVGYLENGDISEAKRLFDHMELNGIKNNLITWNAMISGYGDNLLFEEALSFFRELQTVGGEVNSYTLGSVLPACTAMGSLRRGKEMHAIAIVRGLNSDPFVGEALVEMYCKCHELKAAQLAFDEVTEKDTTVWNALISGFAHCDQMDDIHHLLRMMREDGLEPNVCTWNGIIAGHVENCQYETALQLLTEMQTAKLRPDIYTIGIILPACSKLATIERGKQVHAHSIRCGYESDVYIGAAIVDMYAKCGSIKLAEMVNSRIWKPNLVSQNAMLSAYATHGLGQEGIAHFDEMLRDGYVPDEVTFLSVLSSCVHAGEVEMGLEIFDLMDNFNVVPSLKHYTSMVDLLSRSGQPIEAVELINKMPVEPDSVIWSALLAGCITSGDVELGEMAATQLIELEPNNTGNFVLLANLYAYAGRWDDLARTRQTIKARRMHKSPGCSWIEDGNDVHVFIASDSSHKRTEEIYGILDNLTIHIKARTETKTCLMQEALGGIDGILEKYL
ncbi:hypothetical protein Ancab_009028 [Ancistrocladus abbreviatus]